MFARISKSWELVKASWAVLMADKELLVFPAMSSVALIIVSIIFIVPMIGSGILQSAAEATGSGAATTGASIVSGVLTFLFYLVSYTIIIFSNTALIGAAMIRLKGGDPTVRDGLRIASERLTTILGYALISATVGMILRAIQSNDNIVAKIVAGFLGLAWNIVTFLVIPVLVAENLGPIDAIKRSGSLLRQTWGEQIVGNFTIGAVFGLITLGVILLVGVPLFMLAAATESLAVIIVAVMVIILIIAIISLFSSAMNGIYQAALYLYAAEGNAGDFFDQELIQGAFRPK